MPRKTDSMPLDSPFLDRRVKLLPCQRERIFQMHHNENWMMRPLARMFNVNRTLIKFICYPEAQKANYQRRLERGGSKQYYNKEKWKATMKEHRDYKKETLKDRPKP